jgi:hypothetical protein
MNSIRIFSLSIIITLALYGESLAATAKTGKDSSQSKTDSDSIYPFKCGSAVYVVCFPDTASFLSKIYPIDAEGCIELPLLGKTRISLMKKEQLVEFLNSNYLKYLRNPGIQVRPLIRVAILGGFQRPGIYYISAQSSFPELLQLSGPPIREDGLTKMRWERNRLPVKCDLVKSFESAQSLEEMGIQSGDQICVTPKPLLSTWDIFKTDVLPMFTFIVTTAVTSTTLYFTYKSYMQRQ